MYLGACSAATAHAFRVYRFVFTIPRYFYVQRTMLCIDILFPCSCTVTPKPLSLFHKLGAFPLILVLLHIFAAVFQSLRIVPPTQALAKYKLVIVSYLPEVKS